MSFFSPRRRRKANESRIVDEVPQHTVVRVESLVLGNLSVDGKKLLCLQISPQHSKRDSEDSITTMTSGRMPFIIERRRIPGSLSDKLLDTTEKIKENIEHFKENIEQIPKLLHERIPASFRRLSSTFLRVADLQMSMDHVDGGCVDEVSGYHHYHAPSQEPPPGMDRDPHEQWVALDDGAGAAAPIAPYALAALASFGYKTAMDSTMWKAEGKTDRILKGSEWNDIVWQSTGDVDIPENLLHTDEVMVWTGNFIHGLYGSDIPAVRSSGIINMSSKNLVDLLTDSSRVKEYNSMSLGRTDLLVLQDNLNDDNAKAGIFGKSITKVMSSETQPPVIRKNLQFVSIMHATALEDGCGYLIVSRAVTQASDTTVTVGFDVLRSEILMGVNVIKNIKGSDDRCLLINVNHIRTPMVPLFVGKRLGLAAAPGFYRELRNVGASIS
jgi:hypothetical protein